MPFTDSFDQFTEDLASKLRIAQQMGITEKEIRQRAEDIGDWLAREVNPRNPEQRLLKEMWQVSNQQEQEAIASSLVKLVQRQTQKVR